MSTATTTFEYTARDRGGQRVTGRLDAPNQDVLVQRLRAMGQVPLSVQVANQGLQREITLPWSDRVRPTDLAVLSRQFATMISAGLSLLRALTILGTQTESAALRKVVDAVRADVEVGQTLSTSLAKHPKAFPPLMVNMVRAGEVGGFLDASLQQVADNLEAETKLRAKVKSAMTYPVVVFGIAVLAVIGMLVFIVPVFSNMFTQLGAPLPAPTRLLVSLSASMRVAGPVGLVLAVTGAVAWSRTKQQERVRDVVDALKLRIPVFGQLTCKIAISRLTRNLGAMLTAGVPILQALDIVAATSGNAVVARAVRASQTSVRNGEALAAPLSNHPVIPPMVMHMMAVGEDTGALDTMLVKISDFYDQQVEATTDALTSLIEPLMIAFLGVIIGGMIVALYMPIFTVFNAIQ